MITGLAYLPRTPTRRRLTARRAPLWAPRDVRSGATGVLRRSSGGRHAPPSLDRRATVGPAGSGSPPSLPANRGVDQPSGTKRLGVESRSSCGERRAASGAERRAAMSGAERRAAMSGAERRAASGGRAAGPRPRPWAAAGPGQRKRPRPRRHEGAGAGCRVPPRRRPAAAPPRARTLRMLRGSGRAPTA
jgi:hypothetical protein